jgi:hypothetical protein
MDKISVPVAAKDLSLNKMCLSAETSPLGTTLIAYVLAEEAFLLQTTMDEMRT